LEAYGWLKKSLNYRENLRNHESRILGDDDGIIAPVRARRRGGTKIYPRIFLEGSGMAGEDELPAHLAKLQIQDQPGKLYPST
jgi:hypothetical protein